MFKGHHPTLNITLRPGAEYVSFAFSNYIEKLYNQLPHGAIGYKTPNEYEAEYWGCTV